jgi:hypothetical protein
MFLDSLLLAPHSFADTSGATARNIITKIVAITTDFIRLYCIKEYKKLSLIRRI